MLVQHYLSRLASIRVPKLIGIAFSLLAISAIYLVKPAIGQEATGRTASVEQLTAMLQAIDPYRPTEITKETIEVFGSSSMDALAHGWATGF